MPLVTRQANSGRIFVDDNEPVSWTNGDMWIDTSVTPPLSKINDNGTATSLIGAASEITISSTTNELQEWLFA